MARLGQIIKKLNIGISTATEFLNKKGEAVEQNPHVQLTENQENLLFKEFSSDKVNGNVHMAYSLAIGAAIANVFSLALVLVESGKTQEEF